MYKVICDSVAARTSRWTLAPLLACGMLPANAVEYDVTDPCVVANLAEGSCQVSSINQEGDVAGEVIVNNVAQAAVWKLGSYTNLGAALGTDVVSYSYGINLAGGIVGEVASTATYNYMAYAWHGRSSFAVGPPAYQSQAFGINALGEIIGASSQVANGPLQTWVQNGSHVT